MSLKKGFLKFFDYYRDAFWATLREVLTDTPFSSRMKNRLLQMRTASQSGVGLEYTLDNEQLIIEVSTDAIQGILYESGRGGWKIKPRQKRLLAFRWNPKFFLRVGRKYRGRGRDGRFLFAFVDHPKVETIKWLYPATIRALDTAMGNFISDITKDIDSEIKNAAKGAQKKP